MKSDDSIHFRLMNWGRYQRDGMEGEIPTENAKPASWQKYVDTNKEWLSADAPEPIDDDDAKRVQGAFLRCRVHDHKTARLLTDVYRDRVYVVERIIKRARDRFWRYL